MSQSLFQFPERTDHRDPYAIPTPNSRSASDRGRSKKPKPRSLLATYRIQLTLYGLLILVFILWWFNDRDSGTYSHYIDVTALPPLIPPNRLKKHQLRPGKSAGEQECRRVLEELFRVPFPTRRVPWLANPVTGKWMELDCYNEQLRIACEYNGAQHYRYVPAFHANYDAFRNQQYRDLMKHQMCRDQNIHLLVVPYTVPVGEIEMYLRNLLRNVDLC